MFTKDSEKVVATLTRFGLAFVFLYAAVASLRDPATWASYLPTWTTSFIDTVLLIKTFSYYEIILAIWLTSGRYAFYASLFAAATLVGIIASNTNAFDIIFRDVDILISAVALAVISKNSGK